MIPMGIRRPSQCQNECTTSLLGAGESRRISTLSPFAGAFADALTSERNFPRLPGANLNKSHAARAGQRRNGGLSSTSYVGSWEQSTFLENGGGLGRLAAFLVSKWETRTMSPLSKMKRGSSTSCSNASASASGKGSRVHVLRYVSKLSFVRCRMKTSSHSNNVPRVCT